MREDTTLPGSIATTIPDKTKIDLVVITTNLMYWEVGVKPYSKHQRECNHHKGSLDCLERIAFLFYHEVYRIALFGSCACI